MAGGCAGILVAVCAAPAAAAADPPSLPAPGNSCVGPSPVPVTGVPWATARMAPYQLWPLTQGAGVTVAILDTGVSAAASGLAGAVRPGTDVLTHQRADSDCFGRGTALAHIVAGRPLTGSPMVGMAPAATVVPIRIVDNSGRFTVDGLTQGLRAAVAAQVDVILVGTGLPLNDGQLAGAVGDAARAGIPIVAPVDDAHPAIQGQVPAVWYPAAYDQVIAVGGFGTDGQPTAPMPAASGVDVLAPAAGAVVPGPTGPGGYSVGGSSVAAAYVAGTMALLRSRYPDATAAELKDRLVLTAEPAPGTPGAPALDPYAAVNTVDPGRAAVPVPAARQPVVLPAPTPPDPTIARAWLVSGAVVVVIGLVLMARSVRRLRPGGAGR